MSSEYLLILKQTINTLIRNEVCMEIQYARIFILILVHFCTNNLTEKYVHV